METLMIVKEIMQVASVLLLFMVASMFIGRKIRTEYRRATILFGLWWLIMGATTAIYTVNDFVVGYGTFSLVEPLMFTTWPLMLFAMFGLLYYTLFLFVGSERRVLPISLVYLAVAIAALVMVFMSDHAVITPTNPMEGYNPGDLYFNMSVTTSLLVSAAFLLPQIVVCIALYSIIGKLEKSTQKYRTLLISTSILLPLVFKMVVGTMGLENNQTLVTIAAGITLLSAVIIYVAYKPPKFVKKKGILSIDDERQTLEK